MTWCTPAHLLIVAYAHLYPATLAFLFLEALSSFLPRAFALAFSLVLPQLLLFIPSLLRSPPCWGIHPTTDLIFFFIATINFQSDPCVYLVSSFSIDLQFPWSRNLVNLLQHFISIACNTIDTDLGTWHWYESSKSVLLKIRALMKMISGNIYSSPSVLGVGDVITPNL